MQSLSLRVPEELKEELEAEAEDRDLDRSEYIRRVLQARHDADELRDELEAAEARADDLRRQLAARQDRERDVEQLAAYVEREKELQQRRQQRQDAPVWRRAKWWLFGRSDDGEESAPEG